MITTTSDMPQIGPRRLSVGDKTFVVMPGEGVLIGRDGAIDISSGAPVIVIYAGIAGLAVQLSPDDARRLAQSLVDVAERTDAALAEQATAAINRARGK